MRRGRGPLVWMTSVTFGSDGKVLRCRPIENKSRSELHVIKNVTYVQPISENVLPPQIFEVEDHARDLPFWCSLSIAKQALTPG